MEFSIKLSHMLTLSKRVIKLYQKTRKKPSFSVLYSKLAATCPQKIDLNEVWEILSPYFKETKLEEFESILKMLLINPGNEQKYTLEEITAIIQTLGLLALAYSNAGI